jgi:hypothetical protein
MKISKTLCKLIDEFWSLIQRNVERSDDAYITLDIDEKTKSSIIRIFLPPES